MAKRAVRKQRREHAAAPAGARAAAPGPDATAPAWRTSAFWLGALVMGLAVGAIVTAGFLVLGGGDDAGDAAAPAASPAAAADDGIKSAEELQAEFDARDKRQIEDLTAAARGVATKLEPVMAGLEEALPRDGGRAEQAADAEVRSWLDAARAAGAPYQESISGSTGHNVARSALRAALDGLVGAIATYRLAGEPGADVAALRARAAEQRDNAVRMWSTASVQLDALNVDAGFGHQHVAQLGGPGSGAQPPDTLPEGTDARPE
jgi:hypothetical protein